MLVSIDCHFCGTEIDVDEEDIKFNDIYGEPTLCVPCLDEQQRRREHG